MSEEPSNQNEPASDPKADEQLFTLNPGTENKIDLSRLNTYFDQTSLELSETNYEDEIFSSAEIPSKKALDKPSLLSRLISGLKRNTLPEKASISVADNLEKSDSLSNDIYQQSLQQLQQQHQELIGEQQRLLAHNQALVQEMEQLRQATQALQQLHEQLQAAQQQIVFQEKELSAAAQLNQSHQQLQQQHQELIGEQQQLLAHNQALVQEMEQLRGALIESERNLVSAMQSQQDQVLTGKEVLAGDVLNRRAKEKFTRIYQAYQRERRRRKQLEFEIDYLQSKLLNEHKPP